MATKTEEGTQRQTDLVAAVPSDERDVVAVAAAAGIGVVEMREHSVLNSKLFKSADLDYIIQAKAQKYFLDLKSEQFRTFSLEEHKPLGCTADESLIQAEDGAKHVFVSKILNGGNADKAGMKVGDVIIGITGSFDEIVEVVGVGLHRIRSLIKAKDADQNLIIKVLRGTNIMEKHKTALADLGIVHAADIAFSVTTEEVAKNSQKKTNPEMSADSLYSPDLSSKNKEEFQKKATMPPSPTRTSEVLFVSKCDGTTTYNVGEGVKKESKKMEVVSENNQTSAATSKRKSEHNEDASSILQTMSEMFRQQAELMFHQAQEMEAMFSNPLLPIGVSSAFKDPYRKRKRQNMKEKDKKDTEIKSLTHKFHKARKEALSMRRNVEYAVHYDASSNSDDSCK